MPSQRPIIPDLADLVRRKLQPRIDAALAVVKEVPTLVKERAILDNEDVTGGQMARKVPRPPKHPTNHPDIALIQNDEPSLMSPDRWRTETGETDAKAIFSPPPYQRYLEEKDPNHGGRRWITKDALNPNAKAAIRARMREEFDKGGQQ